MMEIDGSHGEGGGQLLRMAIGLAAVRGREVRVTRIRAGRPNPGLAAQHAAAIRAVAVLCGAETTGADVGSQEVRFRPGRPVGGRHTVEVGTAGSVTLVLQACLPVAFAAPEVVRLRVVGGTDVRWSPPLDYFARVFLPWLRRLGGAVEVETLRRGYYPRGGGIIEVTVHPASSWSALALEDSGGVRRIRGIAHASNLPEDIPRRIRHAALRRLHGFEDVRIEERSYTGDAAVGSGGAAVLWADAEGSVLGASCLAERGKSSERVGEEAAAGLASEIASLASVDVHAADQILPYLCLAEAPSRFTVREATGHLQSMAWLLPQFFDKTVEIQAQGNLWRVTVQAPRV